MSHLNLFELARFLSDLSEISKAFDDAGKNLLRI